MKKDWIMIVTAFAVMFLIAGGLAVLAGKTGEAKADEVDDEPEYEIVLPTHYLDFPDYFEKYATKEQKQALADSKDYGFGPKFWYERQIRIILGEIPEDSPRITLKRARKICSTIELSGNMGQMYMQLLNAFRKYAVPDYNGGSGLSYAVFLLDDVPTGRIEFDTLCNVHYIDCVNNTDELLLETFPEE